jgi:hypothetical protein
MMDHLPKHLLSARSFMAFPIWLSPDRKLVMLQDLPLAGSICGTRRMATAGQQARSYAHRRVNPATLFHDSIITLSNTSDRTLINSL